MTPLGDRQTMEGETVIAVLAAMTPRTIDTLRHFRGSHEPVLALSRWLGGKT